MTTRTTLRLCGLTAAIVVSLALVSSASAKPTGLSYNHSKTITISVPPRHLSGSWLQHASGTSVNRTAPAAPTDRLSPTGAPRVPVTVVERVESSGFGWTDAAIGALFGIGLALIGVIATVALRNRHGRIALGA